MFLTEMLVQSVLVIEPCILAKLTWRMQAMFVLMKLLILVQFLFKQKSWLIFNTEVTKVKMMKLV